MTKVAIIGAGPCGLSLLRAFESAEKNAEKWGIKFRNDVSDLRNTN